MRFKAFASLLIVLLCLLLPAAQAEVCWGTLPLSTAAPEEQEKTLGEIVSVTTLNAQDQLKMGTIFAVDAVDSTLLIVVEYNDVTQLWIWDVNAGFQYGYEIQMTYLPSAGTNRRFVLSADGTVLFYLGRGSTILGLKGTNDEIVMTVYATPTEVENYLYKRPFLSDYRYIACSKGKVIVEAPDGTQITIFDRTSEYKEYAAQKELRRRPLAIRQLIIFLVFMALLIWGLDKSIEPAPPSTPQDFALPHRKK